MARPKGKALREKHRASEKEILIRVRERLEAVKEKQQQKEEKKLANKNQIIAAVRAHGGPCVNAADVNRITGTLSSKTQKLNFLKNEMRYLKNVLGLKDQRLVITKKSVDDMKENFISFIQSDGIGTHILQPQLV